MIWEGHVTIADNNSMECCHCSWTAEKTKSRSIAHRVASNHVAVSHPELVKKQTTTKRKYTKRAKLVADEVVTAKPRKSVRAEVNFCPGCGCNLHAVSVAMGMTT